jgi:predicted SnoaL-like aldol condensation-catalyzing enzyme
MVRLEGLPMNRRLMVAAPVLLAGLAGAAGAAAAASTPKAVVLDFYKMALDDHEPEAAFARYASADFVDYSPDVAGGTLKDAATFLRGLITRMPQGRWTIVRSVAEGELVFLHVRFVPAPGAPEIAIAEIFRVSHGKLVEHWDVLRSAPDKPVNAHPMI